MEADFIHWLREHLPPHPTLRSGLGDDAAVLALAGRSDVVVTTDLVSDGVDFRLQEVDPSRAGRKALAVNLSDLAAMAAKPLAAVIAIALPRSGCGTATALDLAIALYEGMLPLAAEFELAIAGGDTNVHDGPLVIAVTALGELTTRGPLTRNGGRPGDKLLVTGHLGGSILGYHLDFTPRVREALLLHERYELHAGMDISDGLALDLSRLAAESGCGAVVHVGEVPISDAARSLDDPLQHALGDGEDFELLLAASPDAAAAILGDQPLDCPITCVGELVSELGLWQQSPGGERSPLEPKGWLH
jgi:thiamine-monophosphate kinase